MPDANGNLSKGTYVGMTIFMYTVLTPLVMPMATATNNIPINVEVNSITEN